MRRGNKPIKNIKHETTKNKQNKATKNNNK